MSALLELAAKCEAATGDDPDEVRGLLYEAATLVLEQYSEAHYRLAQWADCHAFLDAAMMLVPEGWGCNVNIRSKQEGEIKPSAQCWVFKHGTKHGAAATPALALVSAALRARAILEGEG